MDMIDEELARLRNRLNDLQVRIIPDFENRAQLLYAQILPMAKDSEERQKLEQEYKVISKDLSLRSDELISIRAQMENLELEKNFRR